MKQPMNAPYSSEYIAKHPEKFEERLDALFSTAFPTNDPAMLDYVRLKFELKELRRDRARLDWLDKHQCGFIHLKWGEYEHYSYPPDMAGLPQARQAIDAAMKGSN